ncbi:hypothetical protein [Lachnoclostridium phytofermentans]|uniref:hypothetical protein n=1 Tax=Lachnoclostridium phytofermentans TaxID=66219 RepID=UPI00049835D5|nr:hypothetical protein [Lachnoclostridium phytofermentans]
MFWLNRGYKWGLNSINPINIIILSSGINSFELLRRKLPTTPFLLDPQMYFPINTDNNFIAERKKTYKKLASYPWYNNTPPVYSSSEYKISDFKKQYKEDASILSSLNIPTDAPQIINRIKSCFDFQSNLGVNALIIPTPLATNYEDEFSIQLQWINKAIELKNDYTLPLYATIALSEDIILNQKFAENRVLQTVIDNLSVLDELSGYYLVIERTSGDTYIKNSNLAIAILEMSYYLGHKLSKEFIINFTDIFGFICLGAGATGFSSGTTTKEKRLSFNDYIDKSGGGPALPHFFSYSLACDFFPNRDLSKFRDTRLLRYLENDFTPFSSSLKQALEQKIPIQSIPEWRESPNNITAASNHRIEVINNYCNHVLTLTFPERVEYTLAWIQNAEASMTYINSKLKAAPLSEIGVHLAVWSNSFSEFLSNHNL